jgi:hypothetical protein
VNRTACDFSLRSPGKSCKRESSDVSVIIQACFICNNVADGRAAVRLFDTIQQRKRKGGQARYSYRLAPAPDQDASLAPAASLALSDQDASLTPCRIACGIAVEVESRCCELCYS